MKKNIRAKVLIMTIGCLGCSSGQEGNGSVALQIENAKQPANITVPDLSSGSSSPGTTLKDATTGSSANPLVVAAFHVTVTGAGISAPLVTKAAAAADSIVVQGISPGSDRTFLIEAFNDQGTVIRRRKVDKVAIEAGITTPITTSLNTIPVILNLHAGSVISQKYFHVRGFGEPGASLKLEARAANQDLNLNESVAGGSPPEGAPGGGDLIVSPSISTGLFDFQPKVAMRGKQTITVTDESTNESTSLSVIVVEGEDRPGCHFVAAGGGSPIASIGSSISGAEEGHFPLLVQTLAQTPKEAHP